MKIEPCLPPEGVYPEHEQRTSSLGIQVDSKMLTVMETLWEHGYTTNCSCQGDDDMTAYVSFTRLPDAIAFYQFLVACEIEQTQLTNTYDHHPINFDFFVEFPSDEIDTVEEFLPTLKIMENHSE